MFQFVMFLVVGGSLSPPRVLPEPSFNTHVECVEASPEYTLTYHKAFEVHGQPFVLALACVKTGERS